MPVRRTLWLTLFAVAMGFLEAVVVVYLRELYHPGGFGFPVKFLTDRTATVEIVREATTLIMLVTVALLAGRDRVDRFFVLCYLFGVWDIFYYVGLRAFLGWPPSLLTWDVLFLIPVAWIGPVLYPVLVSCALIGGFMLHERLRGRGYRLELVGREWLVASAGAVLIVVAFCWNWRVVGEASVPTSFPVPLFVVGFAVGVLPFVRAALRASRPESRLPSA